MTTDHAQAYRDGARSMRLLLAAATRTDEAIDTVIDDFVDCHDCTRRTIRRLARDAVSLITQLADHDDAWVTQLLTDWTAAAIDLVEATESP